MIRAGVAVNKGKVVAIATDDNLPSAKDTIDATGKYLLPGLIDRQYHIGYLVDFAESSWIEARATAIEV